MKRQRRKTNPEKVSSLSTKMVHTRISLSGETLEEDEQKEVEVEVFETEPAYVRAAAGLTKNLGNYESLRVDVSISMPCYKEIVTETHEAVADRVSELLYDELDKYLDGENDG